MKEKKKKKKRNRRSNLIFQKSHNTPCDLLLHHQPHVLHLAIVLVLQVEVTRILLKELLNPDKLNLTSLADLMS